LLTSLGGAQRRAGLQKQEQEGRESNNKNREFIGTRAGGTNKQAKSLPGSADNITIEDPI
jgi:hypothetical protein